jgi:hypothetical protein
MLTTVHILVGAAIGKATGNLSLGIPLSVASHYLLDGVPHYQPKPVQNFKEGGIKGANKLDLLYKAIEPIMGVGLVAYLVFGLNPEIAKIMFWTALVSWLPDFIVFLDWKFSSSPGPFKRFDMKFQTHTTFWKGIFQQVIIVAICVFYLIYY